MLTAADRAEIAELCHRYAVLVDARELAEVGALFADDAELVLPEPPDRLTGVRSVRGRAAIEQTLQAVVGLAATAHAVLAGAVKDGPSDGQRRATGLGCGHRSGAPSGRRPDGYTNTVWFLRYHDDYRRVDGQWRFSRRQLDISWIERRPVLTPRVDAAPASTAQPS